MTKAKSAGSLSRPVLIVLALMAGAFFLFVALCYRGGRPTDSLSFDQFTEIVAQHRLWVGEDGKLLVSLITEEGARAKPPSIRGGYYPAVDGATAAISRGFRVSLENDAAVQEFIRFAESEGIAVERIAAKNLLP